MNEWETDGDLPWVSDAPEWEAPDPETWKGDTYLRSWDVAWPEGDYLGGEYGLFKRDEESGE